MRIFYDIKTYQPSKEGASVALGFFDGVHMGHRAVIQGCVENKGEYRSIVLTFLESPAKALGKTAPDLLSDNTRKAELIKELGADDLIFADFCRMKDMEPAEFVQKILCEQLNAKRVYCGFNFHFGARGKGDTAALQRLCEERGIGVSVKEPVTIDDEQVSSSLIRELIRGGEIGKANSLLGYRYAIEGTIGSGNHIGTGMGFPTVNLPIEKGTAIPRFGVYASDVMIDGKRYKGATNIGVHPTVGENETPLCETFLLNFSGGDLYGKKVRCELKEFICPEKRFDSMEELTEQIRKDCLRCQ